MKSIKSIVSRNTGVCNIPLNPPLKGDLIRCAWPIPPSKGARGMSLKPFILCVLIISFFATMARSQESTQGTAREHRIAYQLTPQEEAFLDTLQHRSFRYFVKETNPQNGLVKDRSTATSPSSIAATGFGVVAWAIGAERGWMSREQARDWTLTLLRFLKNSEQSTDSLATGYQGFYYHFLGMKSGQRVWACELSTIDTALLFAGLRFAAQYYHSDNPVEQEIRTLTDELTERMNWDWFTLPDTGRSAGTVSMGWRPERGFVPAGWTGYNEALILYILAAGSDYADAQSAYKNWLRHYRWKEPYPDLAHVIFPPLFGHQYSHIFIDFRGIADAYMQQKGIDYFENARRATYTQRQYATDNPMGWAGYDSLTWGLTACDGPGRAYSTDTQQFRAYFARGTSGPDDTHGDDGTIAPTAAAASIVFAPEIVLPTLQTMFDRYADEGLWGPYGFYDAFNPTLGWIDSDYLGIDQGPIVIMIENFRTGMVWELMMQDSLIRKGLDVLGFRKVEK